MKKPMPKSMKSVKSSKTTQQADSIMRESRESNELASSSEDQNDIIDYSDMQKPNKHNKYKIIAIITLVILVVLAVAGWFRWRQYLADKAPVVITASTQVENTKPAEIATGKIIEAQAVENFNPAQALAIIKQTNKAFDLAVNTATTKQLIKFTSSDGNVADIGVYARVYAPAGAKNLPVIAFATGTTGIGDACAASLENPAKRDWANYDSLMMAYASQGYMVVLADYEGMRDAARMHHYMVGNIEGRTMLDSIRALENLDTTKARVNKEAIFTAGYSQGGHAAFWADAINQKYAPEIKLKGAIGFGPVTSVNETLTDAITANANINWFGPFVLTSYQDWYKRSYPVDKILQPQFAKNLSVDAQRECIDTVNKYWPNNIGTNKSASVYTPEFIAAAKTGNLSSNKLYAQFDSDMKANIVGSIKTTTPKLINQGLSDNVVLPKQSRAGYQRLCASGNSVNLVEYTTSKYGVQVYNPTGKADHYQTMNASFNDTIAWANARIAGSTLVNSCKPI